jgi:cold shock CspA family protein
MQATIFRMNADGSGSALLDDGREVVLTPESPLTSGLRSLRPGQRVSITLGDGEPITATRVWIVGIGEGEAIT